MRAIIIEEDRFTEVLALMRARAESLEKRNHSGSEALSDTSWQILKQDMFRAINYEFVRWAQSHGASCVRQ